MFIKTLTVEDLSSFAIALIAVTVLACVIALIGYRAEKSPQRNQSK